MEKKKISVLWYFVITFAIIGIIIITKTVVVIKDQHEERSIYSMRSTVEYYAKRCYLEEKCNGTVTLQTLYDNEYLKNEVVNPVTKEVINHDLEIKYEDEKIIINW
ncbi:MAG: hypothetical protein IKP76_01130 [Bacilli bacterium]|nr:hypothetical protein [Bacilli bacterium]